MTQRNVLVGCVMATVAGKKPLPPRHILHKTGWSYLTHNRVLHQALARSLRESEVQFVVEDTWPFRERAGGQNDRLIRLRMDFTTEVGARFDNHPRLKNKKLLLDITIVNSCAGSNLGNAARHLEKHLTDAVEQKK